MIKRNEILNYLLSDELKLATVSGIVTTKPEIILQVSREWPIDIITTKSYTVLPRSGNEPPIIAELYPGCYVNAVGLSNPGLQKGVLELAELRKHRLNSLLNISIAANSIDDFIELAIAFEPYADMIELNLSCPHAGAGFGAAIGSDPELVFEYIKRIRAATSCLLFAKLTPNTDKLRQVALAAVSAGIDGITAINTVGPISVVEPYSKHPILNNPQNNLGGMSGEWIKEIAIRCIADIRSVVPENIPIIGIGGVSKADDIRAMLNTGANVVGIGSALARVDVNKRGDYIKALRNDILNNTDNASSYLRDSFFMNYKLYNVAWTKKANDELVLLTLDKSLDCLPVQYAFLWVPGVGERPFSIATNDPLSFIIRKRGKVTSVLYNLKKGDEIYVRGPYGAELELPKPERVYIVAGGSGIAMVPLMAKWLYQNEKQVHVLISLKDPKEALLTEVIKKYSEINVICDSNGKPGLINLMPIILRPYNPEELYFYNIGPNGFLKSVAELELQLGALPENIMINYETITKCGVGICGECQRNGKLLCSEGYFISAKDFMLDRSSCAP